MTRLLLTLIRGYQMSFSKLLPPSCRYYPSCSHYTYEAVERYGWLRGGWMGAARIARCDFSLRGVTNRDDDDHPLADREERPVVPASSEQ